MERKKVEISLTYRERGQDKTQVFVIDFIPNVVRKLYEEVYNTITDVQTKWNEIQTLSQKAILIKDNPAEIDKISEKIKQLSKEIKKCGNDEFFEKRFEIIKMIIQKNIIRPQIINKSIAYYIALPLTWLTSKLREHNNKFLKREFWDECVDAHDIIRFIDEAVNKDFDSKKKAVSPKR